jgi:hypothetical protein
MIGDIMLCDIIVNRLLQRAGNGVVYL